MAYQVIFREIDTDNSGTIEKHELFRYLSRKFPGQYTSYDLDVMMDEADLNLGNHRLTQLLTHSRRCNARPPNE